MVNRLLILAGMLTGFIARAELPLTVKFGMEFSKPEVYAGEQVTANFVVYGKEDVLEVEVAKFPEFRGFWSENLTLRQGPIPLIPDFNPHEWKKSVVGSYLISSMIEEKNPSIRPMKLVIRRPRPANEGVSELLLPSDGAPLIIKPLPALPAALVGKFSGGVGHFALQVDRAPVLFRKDEPTILRFVLSGEGNFREIDEIHIPQMDSIEILSRKSYSQGSAQYYTKSFDLTLAVHSEENLTLPAFHFHYFDPATAAYESITIAPTQFLRAPELVGGPMRDRPVDLGAPYPLWSAHDRWIDASLFWALQLLFLMGTLINAWTTFGCTQRLKRHWHRRPEDPWRPRLAAAQSALKTGDTDGFLAQADHLAFEILAQKFSHPPVTRPELLRRAVGLIEEARLHQARSLFDAWSKRAYSPAKPLPPDPAPLLEALQALVQEAA